MSTTDYSQYPPPDPVPSLSITPWIPSKTIAEVAVLMVFEFIALVCVGMRVYSRIHKGSKFHLNDYAIFWAWFWASALVFESLGSILQGGTGHHTAEIVALAPNRLPVMAKLFLAAQFSWALANAGVKISFIDLYIKIFGGSRRFRQVSYVLMGFTAAYCLVVILNAFLICRPLAYNWNPSGHPNGTCGNMRASYLASGIINLVLDLCVIALPMPMLWRLNMPVLKKISLSLMFGIGFLICGITIWRMVTIQTLDFSDTFYQAAYLGISSCLEPLLGIVAACLPVLQPVAYAFVRPVSSLRSYFSRLLGTTQVSEMPSGDKLSGKSSEKSTRNLEESAGARHFRRLYDHMFPIPSMARTAHSSNASTLNDPEAQTNKEHEITLTTSFEVRSQDRDSSSTMGLGL